MREEATINEMQSLYDGYHFASNMLNVYNLLIHLIVHKREKILFYLYHGTKNE